MQIIACLGKCCEPERGSNDNYDEGDTEETWVLFEGAV